MTDQEILTKVIEKAEENGLKFNRLYEDLKFEYIDAILPKKYTFITWLLETELYKLLLTDHAFCKAFWGEKRQYVGCSEPFPTYYYPWQKNLQQMVITDNWLEYIKQFLGAK